VSPAEVSKAEGELIRAEGVMSALDSEFERRTQESVELFMALNENYSQEKLSQLKKLIEEEGAMQNDFYEHFNKKIDARKKWRQLFLGVLNGSMDCNDGFIHQLGNKEVHQRIYG
jgi:sulfite exporter TauE/SafE